MAKLAEEGPAPEGALLSALGVRFYTALNSAPISSSLKRQIEQEVAYIDPDTSAAVVFGVEHRDGKPHGVMAFVTRTRNGWTAHVYAKRELASAEPGVAVMQEWKSR